MGESVTPNNAFNADQNIASLTSATPPTSTEYAHWDMHRFDAYGDNWTVRTATDSFNNQSHFQYAFYRTKTNANCNPGCVGENWAGTNTHTVLEFLVSSSTTGQTNTTWLDIPVFDLNATLYLFGYRQGQLGNQCLDGNDQTVVCHCPPGVFGNNIGIVSGTVTACFGLNDGVSHSHVHKGTYWLKDVVVSGSP